GLRAQQQRLIEDISARRERDRAATQASRDTLRAQVETARAGLKELEDSRLAQVEAFRRNALSASDFQKQKDDPLSRMTAYQELKNDPKDGAAITLFSWMTKFLVIFLEIVPVVAKMFFSPPSVYAAKIQAQVERERENVNASIEAEWEPQPDLERPLGFAGLQRGPNLEWALADDGSGNRRGAARDGATGRASGSGSRESELTGWMRSDEAERKREQAQQEFETASAVAEEGAEDAAIDSLEAHSGRANEPRMSEGRARSGQNFVRETSEAKFSERDNIEPATADFSAQGRQR